MAIQTPIFGQRVTYTDSDNKYHRGIVKCVSGITKSIIHVVYNCNNDWNNYSCYTAAATHIENLENGWKFTEYEKVHWYEERHKMYVNGIIVGELKANFYRIICDNNPETFKITIAHQYGNNLFSGYYFSKNNNDIISNLIIDLEHLLVQ